MGQDIIERKIGERFDFDGKTLEVVMNNGCRGCYFNHKRCAEYIPNRGYCGDSCRSDKQAVIFKEVTK